MHIYMDETGSFGGVGGSSPALSLVGALIVPSSRLRSLEREYRRIRPSLPMENGEVKGRSLSEEDIARLVPILHHHDVLFEADAIDLGMHTEAELLSFQSRQAEAMTANLTDEHHQSVRDAMQALRKELEDFKIPLMVQSVLTFDIIKNILERAPMFFSQRRPEELSRFHWVIDAKGNTDAPTGWEHWWSNVVLPIIQTQSLTRPIRAISSGHYSHMKRFETSMSSFLLAHATSRIEADAPAIDIGMIMRESFRFSKESEPGIELVDIVTNATRRALVGHLRPEGYRGIPRLMIHRNPSQYISLLAILDPPIPPCKHPYAAVLREFGKNGRNMIARPTAPRRLRKPG
jgi:hypothetical protein